MSRFTRSESDKFQTGNSQLLMDYRDAMIKAYALGEDIKETYGIVPPKILHDERWELGGGVKGNHITLTLNVN
jgi:hypothetical protein